MVLVALGRWNNAAGSWFVRERIYWRGYHWTPFVRVRWRRYEFAMHRQIKRGKRGLGKPTIE